MVLSDERRAVAKRLSGLAADDFDGGEFYDRGEVEDALGLVTDDGSWYEAAGVRSLAKLIEPEPDRTCRNVIESKDEFVCDVCGAFVKDTHMGCSHIGSDVVRMYSTSNEHSFSYCPNCGARVVGE